MGPTIQLERRWSRLVSLQHVAFTQDLAPLATVGVGISLVMAPMVGVVPVAIVASLWFVVVGARVALLVPRVKGLDIPTWILTIATGLAGLRLSSAGLVNVLGERPTLFWNVDWRYASTQAHGIARFGGLQDSLDYAGRPVEYHVGPAWIAGSLQSVVGLPINVILLILVPLTCVAVIVMCTFRLLTRLGVPRPASALCAALPMSMPSNPYLLMRRTYGSFRGQTPLYDVFTDADLWWVSPSLMLNSLLAIAVGLSSACLLVHASKAWSFFVGACGLGSLMAIKPQYAVGLLAVLGLGLMYEWWRSRQVMVRMILFGIGLGTTAAAASALYPPAISFVGLRIDAGSEVLRSFIESFSLLTIGVLVIGLLLLRREGAECTHSSLAAYALGAVMGASALAFTIECTTFLVDAEATARANRIGLKYTLSSQDFNVAQALRPAMELVVVLAGALLVLRSQKRSHLTKSLVASSLLLIIACLPLTLRPLMGPSGPGAYEVAEEPSLARLMRTVSIEEGKWLANDLADPAEDFARPLRATSLTSFNSAQFYLTNAAYFGWAQPDVVVRVQNVQRFFLTDWSAWHQDFLRENAISYLIIRDRCPAVWRLNQAGLVAGVDGPWTLIRVDHQGRTAEQTATEEAPRTQPSYGLSACLDGSGPKI